MKAAAETNTEEGALNCDYLCIGAGNACMAFVDTMLTYTKTATFIIVDKHAQPGGQWNVAYPFATLRQPAACYGVNSEPMGKIDKAGYEVLDPIERSSKTELLAYYARVMNTFLATGRVRFFASVTYDFSDSCWVPCFVDQDGHRQVVNFGKLVTPESDVVVPAMRPPSFPVASGLPIGVVFKPVNALLDEVHTNYVVLGCGWTAIDAV